MECIESVWGICFAPIRNTASLFTFKDFIAALALLVIIFTVSDIRYRFRIAVTPATFRKISLLQLSYVHIGLIGFGTLITDIWISESWLVPKSLMTTPMWQGLFAALFLGLVMTWMYSAFIKPPIFGNNNFEQYAQELYRIILKGSENELPIIAHELAYSAKALVEHAANLPNQKNKTQPTAEGYAHDMLLLIANRKFCRHLVASSPVTAIRFLDSVADTKAYGVPIGLFVRNVSEEAIRNKDSSLYHEDEGYNSGLLGYIKPFSQALYGNYELVEALGHRHESPLDIHYKSVRAWDAEQFETYCRVSMMTFKDYLEGGNWGHHSYTLTRSLNDIQETTSSAIRDENKSEDDRIDDNWYRIHAGVEYITDSIKAIGNLEAIPDPRKLRIQHRDPDGRRDKDVYDFLAGAMFEIIFAAASVKGPPAKAWGIHRNSVWSNFFSFGEKDKAWKIVLFKLRRLLYDEVRELDSLPHYKAAAILGICLNVMGVKIAKRSNYDREDAALRSVVTNWAQKNYLILRKRNADIADACILGSITLDEEKSQLIKTYAKGLEPEPAREYLDLPQPPRRI